MLLQHPCEGADAQAAEANPSFQLKCHPTSLIDIWQLHCGTRVTMRPVLPQDSALLGELIGRLSSNSRRNRFHAAVNRLSAAQLRQMSCVDYQQHMALVITTAKHGQEQVIAEARYFLDEPGQGDIAQFAIMVDDRWQRRGLGARAMHTLVKAASAAGLSRLRGEVLAYNQPMLALMQHCQFDCTPDEGDDSLVHTQIDLDRPRVHPAVPKRARWLSWLGKLQKSTFTQSAVFHA